MKVVFFERKDWERTYVRERKPGRLGMRTQTRAGNRADDFGVSKRFPALCCSSQRRFYARFVSPH